MAVLLRLALALALVAAALLAGPGRASAQSLTSETLERTGPNRLPIRPLRWQTLATPDLDVYFPAGADSLAADAARVAAEVMPALEALVGVRLPARLPVLLYPAPRAFAASAPVRLGRNADAFDGLTDHARGRLVLAFDGDRRTFRQTLVHELVHVLLRVRYGDAGLRALLPLRTRAVFPAWMEEGLAEYLAVGYDPASDHLVRAAVASGTLPPLDRLGGVLAYKGGQSFFHYLARDFGAEALADVLDAAAQTGDGRAALQLVTGLPLDALSRRWQHALDDAVLPEVAVRERLDERAREIPVAAGAFLSSPTFSPDGDRLALVVDDEQGSRLVVLDATDAPDVQTVLRAGPGLPLDALHAGRTVAWSPDGRRVAVAAAEPTREVVVLVDVASRRQTILPVPGFDRLTGLSSSPDGSLLALSGVRQGQSDLAVMTLARGDVQLVTDDPHTDTSPVWLSATTLAFASDRADALARTDGPLPAPTAALQLDLYRLDLARPGLTRLTATTADERPVATLPQSAGLVFTSDANGLVNLYRRALGGTTEALTDLYIGLDDAALSPDGLRVAYLAPGPSGVPRLWIGRQPLASARPSDALAVTAFARSDTPMLPLAAQLASDVRRTQSPFLRFAAPPDAAPPGTASPDSLGAAWPGGPAPWLPDLTARPYRLRFALDALGATARVDPLFGVQGSVNVRASDVLGRHRIRLASNLLLDLRTSDYETTYAYQPFRRTYTGRIFHTTRFVPQDDAPLPRQRFRHYGGSLGAAWPVSPYDRFEGDLTLSVVTQRDVLDPASPTVHRTALVPRLRYIRDLALPEDAAVPRRGSRLIATVFGTPAAVSGRPTAFLAAHADARAYLPLPARVTLAARLQAATAVGTTPPRFFTAGQGGWLAPVRDTAAAFPIQTVHDFALAAPVAPLRGFPVAYRSGRHLAALSVEGRFPLGVLLVPTPRPAPSLVRFSGTAFVDAGVLWGDAPLQIASERRLDDLLVSAGGGLRTSVAGVPLRLDVAWPFDGISFGAPTALLSLGVDF